MRKLFLVLACAQLLPALTAQVYVSPTGNDQAAGTRSAPVRSVQQAILKARKGSHKVLLAGGIYRLNAPIQLGEEDSGLTLTAEPVKPAVLSGSLAVKGWQPVPGKVNLWSAHLPPQVPMPRAIYINGVRATRTRGLLPVLLTQTPTGYVADSSILAKWRAPAQMELVYTGGNVLWSAMTAGLGEWTEPRCPIASIDDKTITMAEPCWTNSTKRVQLPGKERSANLVGPVSVGKAPMYLENAFELLGTPGQFYGDAQTRTLYYTPRNHEDMRMANVEVPVLEQLLTISGSASHPVTDIAVQGIVFQGTHWASPSTSEGFSEIQANYRVTGADGATRQGLCDLVPGGTCPFAAWEQEPGAITVSYAQRIGFKACVFHHLGAAGLRMPYGVHDSVVEGNLFTDIAGNGLELGNVDQPMGDDSTYAIGNRIENNLFEHVGAEFQGGISIVVGYAQRTHIAHNQIDHVPYAGMSLGWGGWRDKIQLAGVENRSTGNVVESNLIRDYMLVLSDGGGIYTQGRTGRSLTDGELVQKNVLINQYGTGHAIYTDNGNAMETIRRNVIWNTNHDNWGSRHVDYYDGGTGQNNNPTVVEDNFWEQGTPDSDAKQVVVRGNHIITSLNQVPADLMEQAGLESSHQYLLHISESIRAPQPPSRIAVHATPAAMYVSWNPSVDNGTSPVSAYHVVSEDGVTRATVSSEQFARDSYVRVEGLQAGHTYQLHLVAVNAAGESTPSLPSTPLALALTPSQLPPRPIAKALSGDGRISLHISAPQVDKGQEPPFILYYTAEINGKTVELRGRRLLALSGRHETVLSLDGVQSGKQLIHLRAVNDAGTSDPLELSVDLQHP